MYSSKYSLGGLLRLSTRFRVKTMQSAIASRSSSVSQSVIVIDAANEIDEEVLFQGLPPRPRVVTC